MQAKISVSGRFSQENDPFACCCSSTSMFSSWRRISCFIFGRQRCEGQHSAATTNFSDRSGSYEENNTFLMTPQRPIFKTRAIHYAYLALRMSYWVCRSYVKAYLPNFYYLPRFLAQLFFWQDVEDVDTRAIRTISNSRQKFISLLARRSLMAYHTEGERQMRKSNIYWISMRTRRSIFGLELVADLLCPTIQLDHCIVVKLQVFGSWEA